MPDEIKEALEEVNQLDSAIKTKAREAKQKADEAKEAAVSAIRLGHCRLSSHQWTDTHTARHIEMVSEALARQNQHSRS